MTRKIIIVAVGAALAIGAGCKKKAADRAGMPAAPADSGSATAVGSAEVPDASAEPSLSGKPLADRYVACVALINDGKLDDFRARCLAAEYKGHQADGPELAGPDALITFFQEHKAAFPDWKLAPQLVLVDGRDILSIVRLSGTHQGPLKTPMGEVPPTNKRVDVLMFQRLQVDEANKAAEEWIFVDPMTTMSQLGLLPKGAPVMRAPLGKDLEGAPVIVVAADDAKEQANLAALKASTDAVNTRKVAAVVASFADNGVELDQAAETDYAGKQALAKAYGGLFKAFPDFTVTELGSYAAGDYAVLIGRFEGTHLGPMGPVKPTKKKVASDVAEVVQLADGKIVKLWRFRNGMAFAAQLGLVPGPAAGDLKPDAPKPGDAATK